MSGLWPAAGQVSRMYAQRRARFLYSQRPSGGQNLWLQGGTRPVEQAAMQANGSLNRAAAARLPEVSGTLTFLSASQSADAANYVAANWTEAVG